MSRLLTERGGVHTAVDLANKSGIKIVDLRFTDLLGTWQHFSIPVSDLTSELFDVGIGFDGSSIRGFQPIHLSDMMLMPDPTTAVVDPVRRIPVYKEIPGQKRIEFRCPDPTANPYLAFAVMLMAGLDGIRNQISPPDSVDLDIYEIAGENGLDIESTPSSLQDAIDALESDHEFLLEGGVFTDDVVDEWIDYKRVNEIQELALRPTPFEFLLYYDA